MKITTIVVPNLQQATVS